jgi:prepilin-type N-terminal cleavage/methylation domain-containing protein
MRRAQGGFSLIEVLVAMTIFAIASLAMSSLMVSSMAMVTENALASEAIGIAQGRIEATRTLPYDDMIPGNICPVSNVNSSKGSTTFTLVCAVLPIPSVSGAQTIRITVRWNYRGVAKSYATETIFTEVTRS